MIAKWIKMAAAVSLCIGACGTDDGGSATNTNAESSDGTVSGAGECSNCISLPKSTFTASEETTLSWTIPADKAHDKNWVAGYATTTERNDTFQEWLDEWVAGESGSVKFTVPGTAGTYHIRMHYQDDYTTSAKATAGVSDIIITVQ